MAKLTRLFNAARNALQGEPSQQGTQGAPGWQARARDAVAAFTGEAQRTPPAPPRTPQPGAGSDADRGAVARYDYLLRTAPPEQLEQVHTDAFARLTPAQREVVRERMRAQLPAGEQPATTDPAALGRAATRAEARHPGAARRLLSGAGVGAAAGAGGLLVAVAGGAAASVIAAPLLEQAAGLGVDFESLAQGVDLEALTGGLGETVSGVGEQVAGAGESVTGLADGIELPGLNDLF